MTKGELVRELSRRAGVKKKDAGKVLNAFIQVVMEKLKNGERVELRGFGTFLTKKRAKRTARNLRTGKKLVIPPKVVPTFKVGKDLKEAVEKVLK